VRLEVLRNAGTEQEARLGSQVSAFNTSSLEDRSTGRFTIPAAGSYTVRVFSDANRGTGEYRFQVFQHD
jgi:hypothetical protein